MKENNYCVIMAGGVGSRFWPSSRNDKPKQFLDFFGTGRSLLQMTVDRFRPIVPIRNIIIVTNIRYRDTVLQQVPDLLPDQVLCEPARRNTAPCIAYATAHIQSRVRKQAVLDASTTPDNEQLNANIVVAPCDHLILQEETFVRSIQAGLQFVAQNDALLTLGMKPTRPETGYGYIQAMSSGEIKEGQICKVKAFTEKPELAMAKMFVESGDFLWNSGIFLWNLQTIRRAFRAFIPEMADKFLAGEQYMGTAEENAFIQEMFPTCPSISIDYGVMEKADNVYVMPSDFGWSDLGTWGSLYELGEKDDNQNVTLHCNSLYYDSHGNMVALPNGQLAVIQGLDNTIVTESDGVLLICKRDSEQQIRQFCMDAEVKYEGKYN